MATIPRTRATGSSAAPAEPSGARAHSSGIFWPCNQFVGNYDLVPKHTPLIVDTRGIYRVPMPHVVRA